MPTKQQQNRQMRNHGNRGTFSSEARRETGPSVGGNSWAATDRGPPEKGGKPFEKHARSRQGNSPRKIRSSVQKDDQENKPVLCTWYRKKKNKLRWHKREHKPFDWYSKSYNRLRRPSQDWTRIQLDCVPAVRGPLQSVDASFFFCGGLEMGKASITNFAQGCRPKRISGVNMASNFALSEGHRILSPIQRLFWLWNLVSPNMWHSESESDLDR